MKKIFIPVFCSLLIIGYAQNKYPYNSPAQFNDNIEVGSLSEAKLSQGLLKQAVENILNQKYKGVHSFLIYKDDKLVFEEYFSGHQFNYMADEHHGKLIKWNADSLHRVMSVSKSITSICVGIAIDKGFIKNEKESIFKYLPEFADLNRDGKENITIESLLTMTSGLQGNELLTPYSNDSNDVISIYFSENPISKILRKPVVAKPGEFFQYYGGNNFLLAEIIRNATKLNLDEFSKKYLFDPLGISSQYWLQLNNGVVDGAGGLALKPRDMLKIGITFLNNGSWNGKQIISKEWVDKSSKAYGSNNWMNNWDDHWGMRGYSYSWWTHSFVLNSKKIDMYYAAGWGGQYIMVIPKLDMVVVFTGENYSTPRPCFDILKKYILPGIQT